MRLMVASIQLNTIHPHVASAMAVMLGKFGKEHPNDELVLFTPQRVEIATGRNISINHALSSECEYLFFLDDDTMCDPNTLNVLIKRMEENPNIGAICPMYRIRGYPYKPMCFKPDDEDYKWHIPSEPLDIDDKGLVKAHAIGNGCTLLRMDIFRALIAAGDNDEWYRTGKFHTEDAYFFAKLRNAAPQYECAIDTTISADHMLGVTWVTEKNVRWLRLKVRLLNAIVKDPDVLDHLENFLKFTEGDKIDDLAIMEYDGSIGRL